jgi:hypothetical protein
LRLDMVMIQQTGGGTGVFAGDIFHRPKHFCGTGGEIIQIANGCCNKKQRSQG